MTVFFATRIGRYFEAWLASETGGGGSERGAGGGGANDSSLSRIKDAPAAAPPPSCPLLQPASDSHSMSKLSLSLVHDLWSLGRLLGPGFSEVGHKIQTFEEAWRSWLKLKFLSLCSVLVAGTFFRSASAPTSKRARTTRCECPVHNNFLYKQ